ncbi:E3 ubiquitin- ligase NRDP1 [Paramuricea clavata]|uniref:E3 ubiquitin- ligase NRDP1 n=1 Tax=Paramuricea clavata TaxID=317549 RepID=A0A7D9E6V3_PARCT|nr:E3 ubiquitin- ligase NRDP1 [Paramuricea clavata]
MASNYQLGYDDERFESIVNRNFHCLICYNVLKDPVMCRRNQHYFCRGCITEHLRRNSHTCPTCADELRVETLQDVPRIVKDYLDELSIRCNHYDRGCRELVQLQNLKRHVAECGFTPVVCGNQGCGEAISKRDRTYHESELCQFRKLKCHNCGEISTMMAGMETKMANLDTNQADMRTKLANVSAEMTAVKTKLTNTNTKLTTMDTKMANISTEMANISTEMANVKTKMAHTDTKLENLHTKLKNVDTKVTNLQANVEAKFEAVNNEVRGMKMSLNEVKNDFHQLKEAVLEKIESGEGKQEEITRDVSGTASGGRENQHIFVAGGVERNSVEIFNCRQRLWSLLKPMPVKRDDASSFVYNNHVTVAGGECNCAAVDHMIQMNIHPIPDLSINWSDFGAKLPIKLYAHSSVVYKDSLFVTGGYNANNVLSDCIYKVQLKPPYAVKLVSKLPEPRVRHSTVLCDDSILIVGGKKSLVTKDNLSSVLSYDIKKNECEQLPALPYPVSDMATVKWAENVVIIGGADKDERALNNVIIYNIKTGNSHMLPPMLHKRKGCMAVVIENTIVVLGGMGERNTLKSVESFSFDNYTWEELPGMKESRWLATAVVI